MRFLDPALRLPPCRAARPRSVSTFNRPKAEGRLQASNNDALPVFYVASLAADSGQGGRDLCVIAHRFGYALVYGAAALNSVPVLGHGCDNPLCQRIGPGHVKPSGGAPPCILCRSPTLKPTGRCCIDPLT